MNVSGKSKVPSAKVKVVGDALRGIVSKILSILIKFSEILPSSYKWII
jgi:hypothetical protein